MEELLEERVAQQQVSNDACVIKVRGSVQGHEPAGGPDGQQVDGHQQAVQPRFRSAHHVQLAHAAKEGRSPAVRTSTETRKAPLRGFLWEQPDSNQRPSACKADALNQLSYAPLVGRTGFEPVTSCV